MSEASIFCKPSGKRVEGTVMSFMLILAVTRGRNCQGDCRYLLKDDAELIMLPIATPAKACAVSGCRRLASLFE